MNAPDPADTLSGHLPSLPPVPRDNGGPLDVLHPWHPWDDDYTEPAPFYTRLINQCGVFATMFAVEERERARAADARAVPVRRFVQPLPPIDFGPAALPPPPLPVLPPPVYPELAEDTLAHEWDTGPGTLVLPGPRRHRKLPPRAPNGQFTREAPGEA
jgi:hypothetical protein